MTRLTKNNIGLRRRILDAIGGIQVRNERHNSGVFACDLRGARLAPHKSCDFSFEVGMDETVQNFATNVASGSSTARNMLVKPLTWWLVEAKFTEKCDSSCLHANL